MRRRACRAFPSPAFISCFVRPNAICLLLLCNHTICYVVRVYSAFPARVGNAVCTGKHCVGGLYCAQHCNVMQASFVDEHSEKQTLLDKSRACASAVCEFWTLEWQLRGNEIICKAKRAIQAGDCRQRRSLLIKVSPACSYPGFFRVGGLRRRSCFRPRMFGGGVTNLSKQRSS
jgi:hypothetical protein